MEPIKTEVARRLRKYIKDGYTGGYCQNRLVGSRARITSEVNLERIFEALEEAELVRFEWSPDDWFSWDDLVGDTYDVELNGDSVPGGERTIKAQEKKYKEWVEQEGVWHVSIEVRTSTDEEWNQADSLGCFVPWDGMGLMDSLKDSGYWHDMVGTAIDQLKEELKKRCPCCRKAG